MLRRVSAAFGAVNQADTNPARQSVQKVEAPKPEAPKPKAVKAKASGSHGRVAATRLPAPPL